MEEVVLCVTNYTKQNLEERDTSLSVACRVPDESCSGSVRMQTGRNSLFLSVFFLHESELKVIHCSSVACSESAVTKALVD